MPFRPVRNAPEFMCGACGHCFGLPFWRRLLRLRPPLPIRCPKCGSRDIGMLCR